MKTGMIGLLLVLVFLMIQCDNNTGTASRLGNELVIEPVRIEFLGHSSFLIVSPDSVRIVTDPVGNSVPQYYNAPDSLYADVVTVSHSHADHAQISTVLGDPIIIRTALCDTVGSVIIRGYLSEHGIWGSTVMGSNIIFVIQIQDVKIVHLGENRNVTEPEILSAISEADIVIAPTGQIASISFEELNTLVQEHNMYTVIPSHYSLSIENRYYGSSTVEEYIEALPEGTTFVHKDFHDVIPDRVKQVVVLQPRYAIPNL